MDPTMHLIARSVQRAVISAPSTTVADAAEGARRAARAMAVSVDGLQRMFPVRRPGASAA